MKKLQTVSDLTPDPLNANEGSLRGEQLLERSLTTYGAARGVAVDKHGLVMAGNKTVQQAVESGLKIRVVPSDGTKLIVVKRVDMDLATPAGRELAYLDNRTSEVGLKWSATQIEQDLAAGVELGGMFTAEERESMLESLRDETPLVPKLLKTRVEFEDSYQHEAWLVMVTEIAERSGTTFPEKLDAWVSEQIARIEGR